MVHTWVFTVFTVAFKILSHELSDMNILHSIHLKIKTFNHHHTPISVKYLWVWVCSCWTYLFISIAGESMLQKLGTEEWGVIHKFHGFQIDDAIPSVLSFAIIGDRFQVGECPWGSLTDSVPVSGDGTDGCRWNGRLILEFVINSIRCPLHYCRLKWPPFPKGIGSVGWISQDIHKGFLLGTKRIHCI